MKASGKTGKTLGSRPRATSNFTGPACDGFNLTITGISCVGNPIFQESKLSLFGNRGLAGLVAPVFTICKFANAGVANGGRSAVVLPPEIWLSGRKRRSRNSLAGMMLSAAMSSPAPFSLWPSRN